MLLVQKKDDKNKKQLADLLIYNKLKNSKKIFYFFKKWRSSTKSLKIFLENKSNLLKKKIFSGFKMKMISKHYFKKFNTNNDVIKKYMFKLLSLLNRKYFSTAFLKIYGFKRVAIALHYYAKDINRLPVKKAKKEEVKEILINQNQSYSQGIISTLCKNQSYQTLPNTNRNNLSAISMNSNNKKK